MKILWLTNGIIPIVANDLGLKSGVNEGWLSGLISHLKKSDGLQLSLCFPQKIRNELISGNAENIDYWGYYQEKSAIEYNENLKNTFKEILKQCAPDVVHIMGTEFPHCYSMVVACKEIGIWDRIVISIQGLVSVYAGHYYAGLPAEVCYGKTLRDVIKRTSLKHERDNYYRRGEYEKKAISEVLYVMGRTDWDRACVRIINPSANYLHGGEILRTCFYDKQWNYENCEKHSVFVSQATYPIKGFHVVLKAMGIVKRFYPDCSLYVASKVPYQNAMQMPRWRNNKYVNFICDLVRKYDLEHIIHYCGALSGDEMAEQFLKSNVFVSASSIENSPNSLGEAMILGVPVVTSDVGGVKNMLLHESEGYVYPFNEEYMLAEYIMKVFESEERITPICANARKHAFITHDPQFICDELVGNYYNIANSAKSK